MRAWPEWWKPYLAAWKRVEGSIVSNMNRWPWSLEDIYVANTKGLEYSVKKGTEYLNQKTLLPTAAQMNSQQREWDWIPNTKGLEYSVKKGTEYLNQKTLLPMVAQMNSQQREWDWIRMNWTSAHNTNGKWRMSSLSGIIQTWNTLVSSAKSVRKYGKPRTALRKE
ncbi:hypothetical protein C2G38_2233642 [Gigaspora rosea]|uniref:Uncharacterized protein n=1 Tax=Gigaspora rosea TaxID=44941 RepID=A0A397TS44_9GLOM|nr:hypothetical protein C2G38_2233642 [Gigaspora rosea]